MLLPAKSRELDVFVQRLVLQHCCRSFVDGEGPVQGDTSGFGEVLGAIFVDLILGIIVGDDGRRRQKFRCLEPLIIWPSDDSPARRPLFRGESAVFHG